MKLLIAEDSISIRMMLKLIVSRWGFEPILAVNGKKAWDILKGPKPPRLVLLDWEMPEMDGLEVCRRVRAVESEDPAFILLLTGRTDTADIVSGLEAGANDYITKPFDKTELQARLQVGKRMLALQEQLNSANKVMAFYISEEKIRSEQKMLIEGQLKHAQKMEAIGKLAAGIAHEINTPAQFVGDNLNFISDSTKDFTNYQQLLENIICEVNQDEATEQLKKAKQQFDISFLQEEIPPAIEQSIEGVIRISNIVSAMKDFSHPGKENKQKVDINKSIESTTIVSGNEWKYLADLQLDFADDLPNVNCFPGEVNQVILNMIVNSCHAIKDSTLGKEKGNILISTQKSGDRVIIKIKDDGFGMETQTMERVFDPFFTTKDVGKGSGQGLSLAYAIIVDKHDGDISVESELGIGTTFTLQLPIE